MLLNALTLTATRTSALQSVHSFPKNRSICGLTEYQCRLSRTTNAPEHRSRLHCARVGIDDQRHPRAHEHRDTHDLHANVRCANAQSHDAHAPGNRGHVPRSAQDF